MHFLISLHHSRPSFRFMHSKLFIFIHISFVRAYTCVFSFLILFKSSHLVVNIDLKCKNPKSSIFKSFLPLPCPKSWSNNQPRELYYFYLMILNNSRGGFGDFPLLFLLVFFPPSLTIPASPLSSFFFHVCGYHSFLWLSIHSNTQEKWHAS